MIYFASYLEPQNHHGQLISISRSVPKGISVAGHLDFFKPSKQLLEWWNSSPKDNHAWLDYTTQFWSQITKRRDPILAWISSLGQRPDRDLTLCCWEKAGVHCHRNLVAKLLRKHCPHLMGGCDVPQFQVDNEVSWDWAYGYLSPFSPFKIYRIEGDRAYLYWLSFPVKLAELRKTL